MTPGALERMVRAGAVGLSAGLILGSMFLTYQGTVNSRYECAAEQMDTSECEFMIETTHQTALEQLAAAMGLALVGAGLAFWLKTQKPSAPGTSATSGVTGRP